MNKHILISILISALAMSGCATAPTSYVDSSTGATVPYNDTDKKILSACATIENSLVGIRAGSALATQLVLDNAVKQDATRARDGAYIWSVSSGIYTLTSKQLIAPSQLALQMKAYGANNDMIDSATDIAGLAQNFSGTYASIYNQLEDMASKATDPTVKATIAKTGLDVLHAIAGGAQDATAKYAPSAPSAPASVTFGRWLIRWSDPREIA